MSEALSLHPATSSDRLLILRLVTDPLVQALLQPAGHRRLGVEPVRRHRVAGL